MVAPFNLQCLQAICDVTSSNALGRLIQCELGEVGWYLHPKGKNSIAMSGIGHLSAIKTFVLVYIVRGKQKHYDRLMTVR